MIALDEKLNIMRDSIKGRNVKVMIIGLGSVGVYLLDYLLSAGDSNMEIYVAGRNEEKMVSDVNIVRVASLIRDQNRSKVFIRSDVNLDDVDSITRCIRQCRPDIIVNSSRAYPGLKYGSISWKNVRAYGIWAPLAIKYTKNIMEAWGKAYPDLGSGNINHLIPRIKFAVAEECGIKDYWNVDITYAVSHFHDVVISKEGQTEGVGQLIRIRYEGKTLEPDMDKIFAACKIPMPTDAKRNMMNASSNFEIIQGILAAVREKKRVKLHCPGAFGEIGGYPVVLDGTRQEIKAYIDEECFDLEAMRKKNRESIYLDGIENIENGTLFYTDELIEKCKDAFGISLIKQVAFEDIEQTARFLISEVIEKQI